MGLVIFQRRKLNSNTFLGNLYQFFSSACNILNESEISIFVVSSRCWSEIGEGDGAGTKRRDILHS